MKIRDLARQYDETDSISQKEDLTQTIVSLAENYIEKRETINEKIEVGWHESEWPCSDFRVNSGSLSLDYVSSDKVHLNYRDHWGYGGQCNESFSLTFDEIENFDPEQYEKNRKQSQKNYLQHDVDRLKAELHRATIKLQQYEV